MLSRNRSAVDAAVWKRSDPFSRATSVGSMASSIVGGSRSCGRTFVTPYGPIWLVNWPPTPSNYADDECGGFHELARLRRRNRSDPARPACAGSDRHFADPGHPSDL